MISLIKIIYRFLKYEDYRKKILRDNRYKKIQRKNFKRDYNEEINKLIVFTLPGSDRKTGNEKMSGGIISILSIAKETKYLFERDKSIAIIVCTLPMEDLLIKFYNIENDFNIYDFSFIEKNFNGITEITVHIPDCYVLTFFNFISKKENIFLQKNNAHINIMNQNIKLMPDTNIIKKINTKYPNTTISTAHQQYCNQFYREYFGVPLHKLSVWVSPENYKFINWEEKENIIAFSPDQYINKEKIEIEIKKKFPNYSIITINNLTYSDYKKLILRAKFVITFGEGLDGYFIEPIFSGGVSFAVYNEHFFTPDYKKLDNIFSSYEDLETNLLDKIIQYDSSESYKIVNSIAYNLCASHYSYSVYKKNIELFYSGNYTFK